MHPSWKEIAERFCPVLDSLGFLKAPFEDVRAELLAWDTRLRRRYSEETFEATFEAAMERLPPLNHAPELLASTASDWVAMMAGRYSSAKSRIHYLAELLGCQGVNLDYVEDTFNPRTRQGRPGATQFALLDGATMTSSVDFRRLIYTMHHYTRWKFHQSGEPLPFEETDRYTHPKIPMRFDQELLDKYCRALGIDAFNPHFYGPRFLIRRRADLDYIVEAPRTYDDIRLRR